MKKISRRSFMASALALSTMPLFANETGSSKETLRFIHVTDSHMDTHDPDSVEALELMVEFINANYKKLDFVLFGGDNFNNNAKGDSDALVFKNIIDKLHSQTLVVRGNKESSPRDDASINLEEFQTLFCSDKDVRLHKKDWKIEKKGYTLLGLDSCIENANNGLYTQETLAFAKAELQKKKPTIILNHHPYTNYWNSKDKKDIYKYVLGNTQEVQKELFGFENLILTLSGHKHIDSVTRINKTQAIVTRGFVRPLDLDMYPMRYVEITDNKISEKLIYTS